MKCRDAGKIIKESTNAEIAGNSELLAHVKECRACNEKYGFILKISLATAMKDKMSLPSDFEDRVWQKIGEPNPSISARIKSMLRPQWAFAAATGAAIAAVFIIYGINKTPNTGLNFAAKPAAKQTQKAVAVKQENNNVNQAVPVAVKKENPELAAVQGNKNQETAQGETENTVKPDKNQLQVADNIYQQPKTGSLQVNSAPNPGKAECSRGSSKTTGCNKCRYK